MSAASTPADIIGFWRDAGPAKWYKRDEAFDREIGERFGGVHAAAAAGAHADWARTAEGSLALLILLDQFSRNLYRGSPKAFAQDAQARAIAGAAIDSGFPAEVEPGLGEFFCMPFMHSESHPDQMRCIVLSHRYGTANTVKFAQIHERIIRRFGRFPHRNEVLGRHTSPAERQFLEGGGFSA